MNRRHLALLSGPALFALILMLPEPAGLSFTAKAAAATTLWMTVWWITEPVSVSVTALLPLVLFPLTGVAPLKTISLEFGNEIIFLFMGGMMLGQAIEKWNLHERIAFNAVLKIGKSPALLVLGFMAATAFISMWISNTATAIMMTPVALAVSKGTHSSGYDRLDDNFKKALMLGVGYACSIGGLGTLIGTPTNAIFAGFVEQKLSTTVTFWQWFIVGFPFAAILLFLCWLMLIRQFPLHKGQVPEGQKAALSAELHKLRRISKAEKRLFWVFGAVVTAWVTGSLVWYRMVPNCNDTVVVLCGVLILFLIPAGTGPEPRNPLLNWSSAAKIPWGVLLLFGGGLALAKGFDASGLASWIGAQMSALKVLPGVLIVAVVLLIVVLLSEIASNIATASMMMPVLAALALAIGMNPFGLLLSAGMAASIGFGLPVATAPNAIVYGSGHLSTRDMARAGFLLDLVSILVLLLFVYTLIPWVWGIQL